MTIHFIGAGPGAADLITVRGRDLIRKCQVVIYAGSLVPHAVIKEAAKDAQVIDSSALTLDEIINEMEAANRQGKDVARVHSGDPSLYGAIGEQMRALDALGIDYDVTPGVPAYAAAAAAIKRELTLPGVSQTVILTRTAVRASAMPKGEALKELARSGATLAVHLSINNLANVTADLIPDYGAECPCIVAYRVSWPDEKIIAATLATIRERVKAEGITRTALILVGPALSAADFAESKLYDPAHSHILRQKRP